MRMYVGCPPDGLAGFGSRLTGIVDPGLSAPIF